MPAPWSWAAGYALRTFERHAGQRVSRFEAPGHIYARPVSPDWQLQQQAAGESPSIVVCLELV